MTYVSDETLRHLRALRVWHWQQALSARADELSSNRVFESLGFDAMSGFQNDMLANRQKANFHITAVQRLNALFPVGDTAEGDFAKLSRDEG